VDKSAIKIVLVNQLLLNGKLAKELLLVDTGLINENKIVATTADSFELNLM